MSVELNNLTSRSLNARDELLLSRAFSLGHHRNFWISALLIQSPSLAVRRVLTSLLSTVTSPTAGFDSLFESGSFCLED